MRRVDLTLPISGSLRPFPGSPAPALVPWARLRGDGYNLEMLFMSSHAGTHIDAPYHFAEGGMRVDRIPLGRLVGRATMLRLDKGAGSRVTAAEIAAFERREGRLGRGASLFVRTGWQARLGRDDYFTDNPGLSAPAARLLASRGISLVGTDSPSIDPGRARSFPAHRILAGAGILVVENLANLDRLRPGPFGFSVLPLRLRGASGSPVRAVATQP